ncbi:competence protein ComK [Fictibacillus terranigra]|uniref:competence protein ComK n=1 Tax=Fictibacillus terranigra TaxID=3058424 RepID=UPI00338F6B00
MHHSLWAFGHVLRSSSVSSLASFFIPLESPNSDTCIWIAQAHVKQVMATSSDTSDIIFSNDTFISVNQVKSTLEAKIHRATHYRFILELRINENNTPFVQRFFRP